MFVAKSPTAGNNASACQQVDGYTKRGIGTRKGNYSSVISDELMLRRAPRLALADTLSERSQTPDYVECGSVYVKFENGKSNLV